MAWAGGERSPTHIIVLLVIDVILVGIGMNVFLSDIGVLNVLEDVSIDFVVLDWREC
jgi:hypothetical protein